MTNSGATPQDYRALMRDALLELRQMRRKLQAVETAKTEPSATEPIAIIGIGCRFPGNIENPADFWQLLRTGKDAITEVPADRWPNDLFYDANPDAPGKIATRYGGFVGHLQDFDAEFFGIADREARSLDPQQRLLLEVGWEALEEAGIVPDHLAGSATGVFVGISSNDYSQHLLSRDRREIDAYLATGNSHSTAAGRLSYLLGLTGPSLAVDTACSSSLVAVHLACQSLRQQECSLALVGGVNRLLSPDFSINFSKAHMLAADGHCKTFDARADGFVRAEGCGVVVLKRLADALAAGDRVWAVIRGSAVNQDGHSSGLTVPNGPAQQAVIRQALANASIPATRIGYIEAHGTGTALGDPIELLALGELLGAASSPVLIGSVKTNLGHLEAAAGIAGLIKVALALHHQEIPPHLHFQQPTPHVPWEELPLQVPTALISWTADMPQIAGVSSFGFSGTNAHLVLSAPNLMPDLTPDLAHMTPALAQPPHKLLLSAKSPTALQALAQRYHDYLRHNPDINFAEVCHRVNTERSQFAEQLSIAASSTTEAIEKLAAILSIDSAYTINSFQPLLLPTYPFQRQRYWIDVERHQNYSLDNLENPSENSKVYHSLIGKNLALSRSQDIYFSHYISKTKPFFLAQHSVLGTTILPASGYIEMALAAGQQTLQTDALTLSNLSIQQPIILAEAEVAVQIVLSPQADNLYQFEIWSQSQGDAWKLHATGRINRAEAGAPDHSKSDCPEPVELLNYYPSLQAYGIEYGDLFQAIRQLWRGDRQALGQIQLAAELEPAPYQCHPVLLDAAFQVIGAAVSSASSREAHSLYLPVGCDRLTLYQRPERDCWSYATVQFSAGELTADLQITNANGELIAAIAGLHLRPVQKPAARPESEGWQDWLYQINWQAQPFPSLPSPGEIYKNLLLKLSDWLLQPEVAAYPQALAELEQISLAYILKAFQQLGWKGVDQPLGVVPQHQQLLKRLQDILDEAALELKAISGLELSQQIVQFQQRYPAATAELTLLQRCGSQLADVLRGQCDPIQLLFPQADLTAATALYQSSTGAALMNRLVQQAVSLATSSETRPLKILEIGAGTGSTTAAVLAELAASHASAIAEYRFTDLSPLFLQKAQQKFSSYEFVKYQLLDIERAPESQGFELGSYDLIIAANVFHATQNLAQTLHHTRSLLASGGLLLLLEGTRPQRWLDLIFGLTEGWWRFSDAHLRRNYPLIGAEQWQQLLQNSGFEQPVSIAPASTPTAPQSLLIARAGQLEAQSHWLIFADQTGLGQQLATYLSGHVTFVQAGEIYQQDGNNFMLNPSSRADFEQLWAAISPTILPAISPPQILYLWGLDSPSARASKSPMAAAEAACTSLLHLLQTLPNSSSLRLVTQGAVALEAENISLDGLNQSAVWGFGKVIALEYPTLRCCCIDLDSSQPLLEQASELQRELQTAATEPQIALRNSTHDSIRYVARLARFVPKSDTLSLPQQPYSLICLQRGTLDQLTLQPTERRSPAATEVEIRVNATGLNLIDVLDTLDLLPFERQWFGVECAGEITAVGTAVSAFQVGDAVVALAAGSFSEYVTVNVNLVVRKPAHLGFTEAATIPAAFLTADYALQLANLQAGERILIHAAATGTGMAAAILAQRLGAEVYATASPSKWHVLEDMGIRQIMNSRSLDFAEQVMTCSQGQGVDVVFNALSGEFIPASLTVLNDRGRFLEIGKRQVWSAAQVAAVKPQVTYHLIDLMAIAQQQPEQIQTRLCHLMQSGIQPLPPTVFPIQQVMQAFRTMQQARHIGKIVVTQSRSASNTGSNTGAFTSGFPVRSDGIYLITGGLGGLGLLVAEWLVQQGAQHLVLVSRRPPTVFQTETLQMLEQTGAQIRVVQADVADQSQLAAIIAALNLPLSGIFHAAGVLDDGVIQQLTWERMANVIAPKLAGAWNLHCLTQTLSQPLDCFVLFSSAAALLGSPGQASHVVANTFLDRLADYRRAIGQPGLSINWGAWSEVGAAAKRQVDQQMQMRGIGAISPEAGLQALASLLGQSAAQIGVIPIQWQDFLQQDFLQHHSFFSAFRSPDKMAPTAQPDILGQLTAANAAHRLSLLITYLQTELAKVLGLPAHRLPKPDQGFFDLGMDSLMAVELKNRLETQLQLHLTTTTIFEYSTIRELAKHLAATVSRQSEQKETRLNRESTQVHEPDSDLIDPEQDKNPEQDQYLESDATNSDVETEILNELKALESLLS